MGKHGTRRALVSNTTTTNPYGEDLVGELLVEARIPAHLDPRGTGHATNSVVGNQRVARVVRRRRVRAVAVVVESAPALVLPVVRVALLQIAALAAVHVGGHAAGVAGGHGVRGSSCEREVVGDGSGYRSRLWCVVRSSCRLHLGV